MTCLNANFKVLQENFSVSFIVRNKAIFNMLCQVLSELKGIVVDMV